MPNSSKKQQVNEQRLVLLIGDKISKSYNHEYEKSQSDILAPAGSIVGMDCKDLEELKSSKAKRRTR